VCQWKCCWFNTAEQKNLFPYQIRSFLIRYKNQKIYRVATLTQATGSCILVRHLIDGNKYRVLRHIWHWFWDVAALLPWLNRTETACNGRYSIEASLHPYFQQAAAIAKMTHPSSDGRPALGELWRTLRRKSSTAVLRLKSTLQRSPSCYTQWNKFVIRHKVEFLVNTFLSQTSTYWPRLEHRYGIIYLSLVGYNCWRLNTAHSTLKTTSLRIKWQRNSEEKSEINNEHNNYGDIIAAIVKCIHEQMGDAASYVHLSYCELILPVLNDFHILIHEIQRAGTQSNGHIYNVK